MLDIQNIKNTIFASNKKNDSPSPKVFVCFFALNKINHLNQIKILIIIHTSKKYTIKNKMPSDI